MSASIETPAAIKEEAAKWIARRDAGLTVGERTRFERWLAADPRHRAALRWYGGPWAALDRPARAGVAGDVLEQLQVLDRRQRRRRVASAVTAAALLLIGGAFWLRAPSADMNSAATAKLVLPLHRVLPDGTTVDLKDDAEIAVHYSAAARRVTLRRGEAHFQVMKGEKPFIVTARGAEFRAVGTAFSIQLDAQQVELLVTEGRVAVDKPGESASTGQLPVPQGLLPGPVTIVTVDAGNRLIVPVQSAGDRVPAPAAVSAADISSRLAWRVPRLEFTGTPLVEAVEMLNRQLARQNVRLVIEDSSIERIKISGLFRADRTAELIELLETGFGIKVERRGDSEIVLRHAN